MTSPAPTLRLARSGDETLLDRVAAGVFDHPVDPELWRRFLSDPRHHIVVALEGNLIVGMATGVDYIHPDKPAELFVNEVGVASGRRGQGIGRRLLEALLDHGRSLGCREAWVLADPDNAAAARLYRGANGHPSGATMYSFPIA